MHDWGYTRDTLGPHEWPKHYAVGRHQSPINIHVDPRELSGQRLDCNSCGLSQQLRDQLSLGPVKTHSLQAPTYRLAGRAHLDSVGNDDFDGPTNLRSASTSSAGSEDLLASPRQTQQLRRHAREAAHHQDELGRNHAERHTGTQINHNHNHATQTTTDKHAPQHQTTRLCLTSKKIFLGYPRYLNSVELCNTGHAWQINISPELAAHTLLAGPPLVDREYRLAQLHCHWGESCAEGSEHLINGRPFSAEIHFVHWNCSQFKSMEEASKHKHGLAVVAVLVEALDGERHRNKHLDKIVSRLALIRDSGASHRVSEFRLDLKKLLPVNRWNYAAYEGSLTTPPLSEVVDWIVFLEPIQCGADQIEQFRQLKCPTGAQLAHNCRPTQPAHGRVVSIWSHSH